MGELNPTDIAGGDRPSLPTMFARGAVKHCPRCGQGHLFNGWWTMKERCPRCGLPLAYRKLGPNHGMLECPALCGYRRFVGNPSAGR